MVSVVDERYSVAGLLKETGQRLFTAHMHNSVLSLHACAHTHSCVECIALLKASARDGR